MSIQTRSQQVYPLQNAHAWHNFVEYVQKSFLTMEGKISSYQICINQTLGQLDSAKETADDVVIVFKSYVTAFIASDDWFKQLYSVVTRLFGVVDRPREDHWRAEKGQGVLNTARASVVTISHFVTALFTRSEEFRVSINFCKIVKLS